MECFRYGHLTNFINKKMWSRWDLLTEMVGCYHHLNGGLSLTWSEKLPDWNDCVGTGPVGTSEKSLGFSFCSFHVIKNWTKPTTIDFRWEISHVDAPLWKSPEVRIIYLHLQPYKSSKFPQKSSPRCFDSPVASPVHPGEKKSGRFGRTTIPSIFSHLEKLRVHFSPQKHVPWCPSSLAKLVNITPISLWFMADITTLW